MASWEMWRTELEVYIFLNRITEEEKRPLTEKAQRVPNRRGDLTQRYSTVTLKGIEEKEKVLKYFKDKNHITQKEQDSQIIIILYMIIYMCFIYSCIVSNYTWYEKAVKWYLQSVEEKTVKLKFYNERNYYLNVRLKWRYSGAYIIS